MESAEGEVFKIDTHSKSVTSKQVGLLAELLLLPARQRVELGEGSGARPARDARSAERIRKGLGAERALALGRVHPGGQRSRGHARRHRGVRVACPPAHAATAWIPTARCQRGRSNCRGLGRRRCGGSDSRLWRRLRRQCLGRRRVLGLRRRNSWGSRSSWDRSSSSSGLRLRRRRRRSSRGKRVAAERFVLRRWRRDGRRSSKRHGSGGPRLVQSQGRKGVRGRRVGSA